MPNHLHIDERTAGMGKITEPVIDVSDLLGAIEDNQCEDIRGVWDAISAQELVNNMRDSISLIIAHRNVPRNVVDFLEQLLREIGFKMFGFKKFIDYSEEKNPSQSVTDLFESNMQDEEVEQPVSFAPICVICDKNNHIISVNPAYIKATWLDTISQDRWRELVWAERANMPIWEKIQILSQETVEHTLYWKISKLYNEIYDTENLEKFLGSLEKINTGNSAGYVKILQMKITKRFHLWTSLWNKHIDGSIRVAMEINSKKNPKTGKRSADQNHPAIVRLRREAEGLYVPKKTPSFGLYTTMRHFHTLIERIIQLPLNTTISTNEQQELEATLSMLEKPNDLHKDVQLNIDKLLKIAIVADTIIDHSPFLVRWFDGTTHGFNRAFAEYTNPTPEELLQAAKNGTLIKEVYIGKRAIESCQSKACQSKIHNEEEFIKWKIDSLRKVPNYTCDFFPIRGGEKVRVVYNTSRYDQQWEDPNRTLSDDEVLRTFWIGTPTNFVEQ